MQVVHRLPELARLTKNFTGAELEGTNVVHVHSTYIHIKSILFTCNLGLVRSAASFALARNIDASSIKVQPNSLLCRHIMCELRSLLFYKRAPCTVQALDIASIKVEWNDFERALGETTPAFGNKDSLELLSYFRYCMYLACSCYWTRALQYYIGGLLADTNDLTHTFLHTALSN